jgi:hypothetical protein
MRSEVFLFVDARFDAVLRVGDDGDLAGDGAGVSAVEREAQHAPESSDDSACQRCCGETGSESSFSVTKDGSRPMCT